MPTHSEVSCCGLLSKQAFAVPDFAVDPRGMTVFHVVLLSIVFCPRTGSRIRVSDPPCCDVCATIDESILSIYSVFLSSFYFNGAIESGWERDKRCFVVCTTRAIIGDKCRARLLCLSSSTRSP